MLLNRNPVLVALAKCEVMCEYLFTELSKTHHQPDLNITPEKIAERVEKKLAAYDVAPPEPIPASAPLPKSPAPLPKATVAALKVASAKAASRDTLADDSEEEA